MISRCLSLCLFSSTSSGNETRSWQTGMLKYAWCPWKGQRDIIEVYINRESHWHSEKSYSSLAFSLQEPGAIRWWSQAGKKQMQVMQVLVNLRHSLLKREVHPKALQELKKQLANHLEWKCIEGYWQIIWGLEDAPSLGSNSGFLLSNSGEALHVLHLLLLFPGGLFMDCWK